MKRDISRVRRGHDQARGQRQEGALPSGLRHDHLAGQDLTDRVGWRWHIAIGWQVLCGVGANRGRLTQTLAIANVSEP